MRDQERILRAHMPQRGRCFGCGSLDPCIAPTDALPRRRAPQEAVVIEVFRKTPVTVDMCADCAPHAARHLLSYIDYWSRKEAYG